MGVARSLSAVAISVFARVVRRGERAQITEERKADMLNFKLTLKLLIHTEATMKEITRLYRLTGDVTVSLLLFKNSREGKT